MADCIEVGGTKVTQEVLNRMIAACREHNLFRIPSDYDPSLEKFAPLEGSSGAYEQILYEYMRAGTMPKWFASEFARNPTPAHRKAPAAILKEAGFPRSSWSTLRPWEHDAPTTVAKWAAELDADNGPWLWVICDKRSTRSFVLAQAALAASESVRGEIIYKESDDLCGEYNSADLYGENNKHSALMPYRRATLLLLDGLGTERRGTREASALAKLVQARQDQNLPTVIGSEIGLTMWLNGYFGIDPDATRSIRESIVLGLCGNRELTGSVREDTINEHVARIEGSARPEQSL